MLNTDERELVEGLLLDYLSTKEQPRSALCSVMPVEFAHDLKIFTETRFLVTDAVGICIADQYTHNPAWLVVLITALLADNPKVAPVLTRLSNPPPPAAAADPLDALLLTTDAPFLSRAELRQTLKVLRQPGSAKPILVVTGPRWSGKTYSTELIDDFCRSRNSLILCQVTLSPRQEKIIGAREIASDLVAQLGPRRNEMPPVNTNEDRWAQELATWVLTEAVGQPGDWWFVLDGFNGPEVRPDALKFIAHLADQVTRGVFARRCRVILLNFDRTGLSVQPSRILLEAIKPPVEPDEVEDCVEVILRRTDTNADAHQVTAAILQGLPTDETRLPVLNQRLSALLEEAANV